MADTYHTTGRSFHVMVKPVGSRCNLDCAYCYYLNKDELLANSGRMSDELLEEVIRQSITSDADTVLFTWHGGEPTLLGLDFFRRVIEIEKKYANGRRIENDLQTNGVLIDDSWCEFLKENDFLVGLSIDGPKHLHDCFRMTKAGEPSFDKVYRAAKLLQKHGVLFNTMTVINSVNVKKPDEVYDFLTEDLGSYRLQWLPCVEPKDFLTTAPGHTNVVTEWSVDPDEFGEFLCRTFDLWLQKGLGRVLVNWFESLVGQWMGQPPQICTLAPMCGRSAAIEKDGSIYSCDHFVYPEYRLGSVKDGIVKAVNSDKQRQFGCAKLPESCRQCKYCFACYGECPKNRFNGANYLCSGLKRFFAHADPHLREIVRRLNGSIIA